MLFKKRGDADKKARKNSVAVPAKGQHSLATGLAPSQSSDSSETDTKLADTPHAQTPQVVVGDTVITVTDIAQLEFAPGRAASGEVSDGWLTLGSKDGGRSAETVAANEGDTFIATAQTRLVDPGENGKQSRYFFGPMFFDADDTVLKWWIGFDKPAESPAEISVVATAPAGTAKVRLGVRGTYDGKGETGDYVVGFSAPRLSRAVK